MKIRWHPRAEEELEEIGRFIAKDSIVYSIATVKALLSVAKSAAEQPMLGRIVPETDNPEIRERIYRDYRVIYRIGSEHVEIVAVRHCARRFVQFTD